MTATNLPGVIVNGQASISGDSSYSSPATVCILAPVSTLPSSVPSDFWQALAWTSNAGVQGEYGAPFNADGSVNSYVSLGAYYAFLGGANTVITQPYASASLTGGTSLSDALSQIQENSAINLVAAMGLSSTQLSAVSGSIQASNNASFYRRAILAIDSGNPTIQDLQTAAGSVDYYEVMLVGNTGATSTNGAALPPSCYACEMAGIAETLDFDATLTNQLLSGFALDKSLTRAQLSTLIGSGLCCISSQFGGNRVIEARVTTQGTALDFNYAGVMNYISSELSAYYNNFIGVPLDSATLLSIKGQTLNLLNTLETQDAIAGYSNVSVSQNPSSPTQIFVTFTAQWMAPLYQIEVNFSFDTSSETGVSSVSSQPASASTSTSTSD